LPICGAKHCRNPRSVSAHDARRLRRRIDVLVLRRWTSRAPSAQPTHVRRRERAPIAPRPRMMQSPSMKQALRLRAIAPFLLLAIGVTNCKAKETLSTPLPPPSSHPASAGPPAKSDPTDDVCVFFTKEIAKQAFGADVEGPEHIALTHGDHLRDDCRWRAAGNPRARLTGTVSKHAYSRDKFVSDTKSSYPTAEVVSGIGEAAFLIGEGTYRQAVAFTPAYTVNVLGGVPDDKLKGALIQFVAGLPK
jgi:hypothetical protein